MRADSPQGLKLFRPPGASLEPFVAAALSSFCDYTLFLMANFCTGFRKESLWVTSIFLNVFLLLIRLYPKEIHEEMEQREVRQCCAAARWSFEIAGAVRYVVRLTQWLPTLRLIQTPFTDANFSFATFTARSVDPSKDQVDVICVFQSGLGGFCPEIVNRWQCEFEMTSRAKY